MTQDDANAFYFAQQCMLTGREVVLVAVLRSNDANLMIGAMYACADNGLTAGSEALGSLVSREISDAVFVSGEPKVFAVGAIELMITRVG
ncbi:MAG: hypothetical protein AAFO77_07035 [Pseudomonadota bacterium]